MECKARFEAPGQKKVFRINRNIMECKVKQGITDARAQAVLIETLWNVKKTSAFLENRFLWY